MEEQLVVLLDPWRDKYDRLLEANDKLQKLNQNLEEKMLKLAENNHAESQRLSYQIQELTQRLVEARIYIHQLEDENDRYRNDINVVVQLLHCKPSNFVSPKLETLPEDLQKKVLGQRNGSNCKKEKKIIKVQVPTFPPTDIIYPLHKPKGKKQPSEGDLVSAAIMAKILQERENERLQNRKNRCKCASKIVLPLCNSVTQTLPVCTISYSDFNFDEFDTEYAPHQPQQTQIDLEEEDEDDEEEEEEVALAPTGSKKTTDLNTPGEESLPHPGCSSQTIDDIMKTDSREEELLPTPLFLRRRDVMKQDNFKSSEDSGFLSSSSTKPDQDESDANTPPPQAQAKKFDKFEKFEKFDKFEKFSEKQPPSPQSSSVSPVSSSDLVTSCNNYYDSTQAHPPNQNQNQNHGYESSSSSGGGGGGGGSGGYRKLPGRPVSMNFHKERDRWDNFGGGGGGSPTYGRNGVSHWRSTVLVHNPPKKSFSYEPLATSCSDTITTTTTKERHKNHDTERHKNLRDYEPLALAPKSSGKARDYEPLALTSSSTSTSTRSQQQTTFSANGSREHLVPEDEEDERESTVKDPLISSFNKGHLYGSIATSANSVNSVNAPLLQSSSAHQYYRAQKRTFWTRSSSTTSTETEI